MKPFRLDRLEAVSQNGMIRGVDQRFQFGPLGKISLPYRVAEPGQGANLTQHGEFVFPIDILQATGPAMFLKRVREEATSLGIADEILKRPVNVGFSGGEKKRMEILQMAVLEPSLCVLDETDSGLDIDAVRVVSAGVTKLRSKDRAMLVITHYQRLLNYIVPDKVHVMAGGTIRKTGGKELALELEKTGYAEFKSKALESA